MVPMPSVCSSKKMGREGDVGGGGSGSEEVRG